MDNRLLLVKSITLLYRESQLIIKTMNSSDLVKTVVESIAIADVGLGISSERDILMHLRDTAIEMCQNPLDYEYSVDDLLQRLKLNCGEDSRLYEILAQGIETPKTESQIKRTVANLQRSLHNFFREQQINEVLNKASYQFKFHRDKITDVNTFISDLMSQLEPLQSVYQGRDPAVMTDIDIGDVSSLTRVFENIQEQTTDKGMLKTGWQRVNAMLNGGFRRGEFVCVPALQHKYKTGFTLSLFKHFAIHNVPYMLDSSKKPLLLRISFEDDIELNIRFLYQALKMDESHDDALNLNIDVAEMSAYIKARLQVNGYHVKMIRVDPSQWTYKHICNKVLELEAQGYEVHVLMIDYLSKLPRTGCMSSGPSGTDLRDMYSRMRNFCAARKTLCITPHQLSTDVKGLIRTGLPEDRLLKEIAWKGYFESSKQLDQEYDVGLYVHLFKHNKESWLSIYKEKHRGQVTAEDDVHALYRFPKMKLPIADDLLGEDTAFMKLPTAASNADAELFSFTGK